MSENTDVNDSHFEDQLCEHLRRAILETAKLKEIEERAKELSERTSKFLPNPHQVRDDDLALG